MRLLLGLSVAAALVSTGVVGQAEVAPLDRRAVADTPPGIDRALWCASAFYWLAGSAQDAGDAEDAALYDGWSGRLLEMASAALIELGTEPAEIERLIATYDEVALDQLGTEAAPYDIADCPDLVEAAPAAEGSEGS